MKETANSAQPQHLIFGIRPVIEALEAGKEIDKIFIQKGTQGDLIKELQVALRARNFAAKIVPAEKMDRLTRKNHQGVVAFLSPIDFADIEAENVNIRIVNNTGKTLLQQVIDKPKGTIQVDVASLEAGQYMMYLETQGKKAVVRKLTIMK